MKRHWHGGRPPRSPEEREADFWRRVRVGDGCWVWLGCTLASGYGQFDQQRAHRFAWSSWHDQPAPSGRLLLHRCDNRRCVRPSHLFLGTHAENMADRNAKGRQARGERIRRAVLTAAAVLKIRARVAKGEARAAIAADFGITRSAVQHIVHLRSWRHVQEVS